MIKNAVRLEMGLLAVALAILFAPATFAKLAPQRIILLHFDDFDLGWTSLVNSRVSYLKEVLGPDLYRNRSATPTPNLEKLAKESVLLDRYYVTSSICTPSRWR